MKHLLFFMVSAFSIKRKLHLRHAKGFGFTNFELDFKDYILNTNKIRIVFKILTTDRVKFYL